LLQFFGSFFVPESPRFLVSVGKEDAARAVFNTYHVGENSEYADIVDFEMSEIRNAIAADEASRNITYVEFFRTKENRLRLFVLLFLAVTTQLAGNGLVSCMSILKRLSVADRCQIF
jgi:hypothetical protein